MGIGVREVQCQAPGSDLHLHVGSKVVHDRAPSEGRRGEVVHQPDRMADLVSREVGEAIQDQGSFVGSPVSRAQDPLEIR